MGRKGKAHAFQLLQPRSAVAASAGANGRLAFVVHFQIVLVQHRRCSVVQHS
jgi:hypothetical protein